MPAINSENRDAWQHIADECSKRRPDVGKRVKVVGGRKHKGKEGIVTYHGVSKFEDPFRYASEAQAAMREMAGRFGYYCEIREDNGASFNVPADYTEVL